MSRNEIMMTLMSENNCDNHRRRQSYRRGRPLSACRYTARHKCYSWRSAGDSSSGKLHSAIVPSVVFQQRVYLVTLASRRKKRRVLCTCAHAHQKLIEIAKLIKLYQMLYSRISIPVDDGNEIAHQAAWWSLNAYYWLCWQTIRAGNPLLPKAFPGVLG